MLKGSIGRRKSGSAQGMMESTGNGGQMGDCDPERSLFQDSDETGEIIMEDRKESENCLLKSQLGVAKTI